jgi:hypothetical protein
MKRTTSLISVLCALAMVMVTYTPARAEYVGTFTQSTPYTFEVQTTTKVAVTFLLITSKGRLDVEDVLTFDANTVGAQQRTIPRNIDRVIVKVDVPTNAPVLSNSFKGLNSLS